MDRLLESAEAVNRGLLNALYQMSLIEYHMDCSRSTPNYLWILPPSDPKSHPHLYHNDCKVIAAIIRCKLSIEYKLNDGQSSQAERELVFHHPVWKTVKDECNIDSPALKN